MAQAYKWQFKARFRRGAYGWRGTKPAAQRLKEAVSEIKKVNRSDSLLAGEGAVSLMERLWPALEHIDSSSGILCNAVYRTLNELIPILIKADADKKTRKKWMERLYDAVADDGVDFLCPVQERWGEICVYDDLKNEWADFLCSGLKSCWQTDQPGGHFVGTDICLSSLLESGRYTELAKIISLRKYTFWSYDKFYAEALLRQGRVDEAIRFAESRLKDDYGRQDILSFCERALIESGRKEEAYLRYGLVISEGTTYLATFRAIVKKYPELDPRKILMDLIAQSDDKGAWFASARQAGYLDIAKACAFSGSVEPKTLNRAARDTIDTSPEFAAEIALRSVDLLLSGHGYEVTTLDVSEALRYLMTAAEKLNKVSWAVSGLKRLSQSRAAEYNGFGYQMVKDLIPRYDTVA